MRPDLDACAAVWLLTRHLHPGVPVQVRWVPAGTLVDDADYVVDTGGVWDPARGRFDHHVAPLARERAVCATSLVWRHLLALGRDIAWLAPLIDLVTAGDHGQPPAESVAAGLHAILNGLLLEHADDHRVLQEMLDLLDAVAHALRHGVQAPIALAAVVQGCVALAEDEETLFRRLQVVTQSIAAAAARRAAGRAALAHRLWVDDAGVVATLADAGAAATRQVFELHPTVRLVVWVDHTHPGTVAAGVQRRIEDGFEIGDLLDAARLAPDLQQEVGRWYRHPSGAFALRGSVKNPDPTPFPDRGLERLADAFRQALDALDSRA